MDEDELHFALSQTDVRVNGQTEMHEFIQVEFVMTMSRLRGLRIASIGAAYGHLRLFVSLGLYHPPLTRSVVVLMIV